MYFYSLRVEYIFMFCWFYFWVCTIFFSGSLAASPIDCPHLPCVCIRNVLSFAVAMAHNGECFTCLLCVWPLLAFMCSHEISVYMISLMLIWYGSLTTEHVPLHFRCLILHAPSRAFFGGKNLLVNFPNKFLLHTEFLLIYNVCIKFLSVERFLRLWYV